MKLIKIINKANLCIKRYTPLLSVISLIGVVFAIINPYCLQSNQNNEKLSIGIYSTPVFWTKINGKEAISIDLRISNQGSKVCVISQMMLVIPYRVKSKSGYLEGFAETIEAVDSSSKETIKEILIEPNRITKKRFHFVYYRIGGKVETGVAQDTNYSTEATLEITALDSKCIKYFAAIKACSLDICNSGICGISPIEKNMIDIINDKNKDYLSKK
jgi:hypothetical protein